MRRYVPPWSFGVVLAILGVGTVIGVGVVVILHKLSLAPLVIGIALAVGVIYIVAFARPFSEPESPPAVEGEPAPTPAPPVLDPAVPTTSSLQPVLEASEPYEPFYDPVEEADRLDSAKPPGAPPTSGSQDPE